MVSDALRQQFLCLHFLHELFHGRGYISAFTVVEIAGTVGQRAVDFVQAKLTVPAVVCQQQMAADGSPAAQSSKIQGYRGRCSFDGDGRMDLGFLEQGIGTFPDVIFFGCQDKREGGKVFERYDSRVVLLQLLLQMEWGKLGR